MPKVFVFSEKNLQILFQRLKNYELTSKWKSNLFKQLSDPNNLDDEDDAKMPDNDLEMLKLKTDLKNYFKVLTMNNFYAHVESAQFTIVFIYLPCINKEFKKSFYKI